MDNAGCWIGAFIIFVILAVLYFIIKIVITIVSVIGLFIFAIPTYVLFGLYVVLEFISTNILIALDKVFHPGFHASPVVIWAFWGLVIGAAIQGYREMNIYGRKERGVLIALAPVVLLAILKLIKPPGLGSFDVYSMSSPVAVPRQSPSPPPTPKDDHSDTRSGATSLSFRGPGSGRIDPGSDVDYFKVQVRKLGVLTVYTTGKLDTRGEIQYSNGAILERDLDDGSGNNFKIERSVNAGIYYIKVESYKSYTGSYTMHASFREQSPKKEQRREQVALEKQRREQAALEKQRRENQARQAELERQRQIERQPGRRFEDCAECPEMVVVPTGSFMMGSPSSEKGRDSDESPQHRVRITQPFAVGVNEVTFAEWDACVSAGGCNGYGPADRGWGRGQRPVIYVSWNDAQSYVEWLSNKTGKRYRLLSEAEWEYVARAGTKTPFHFGMTISTDQANYNRNYRARTVEAGVFPPNGYGLHDVHGNVDEWVQDCWNDSYLGAPTDGSAWTSGDCSGRVLRGGSWDSKHRNLHLADRNWGPTNNRSIRTGFRVARTF